MTHVRTTPILLALLATAACPLEPVKLGGQELEGSSTNSTSSDGDTTMPAGPVTEPIATEGGNTDDDPSDPSAGGSVGAACNHGDLVIETATVTFPALACEDLLCVYADNTEAPADPCDIDADCNGADPGRERFMCHVPTQQCVLDPAYVDERSFCSLRCEDDSDCLGEEPSACQTGFSCTVMTQLGAAAGCQGVCACNDDVDVSVAHENERDCLDGTASACTQNPGQGLCPE